MSIFQPDSTKPDCIVPVQYIQYCLPPTNLVPVFQCCTTYDWNEGKWYSYYQNYLFAKIVWLGQTKELKRKTCFEDLLPVSFKTGKTVFKISFFLQFTYFHESKVLGFD